MIFAVADCLAYLTGRGRYSSRVLTARGWRRVTPEMFAEAERLPPATIFVVHPRRSMVSWLVMYATNSAASHTAIYLGEGYICDATTAGTMIRPLSDLLGDGTWFVDNRDQPIPDEARARIVEAAVRMVGTPFGWGTAVLIGMREATGHRPDHSHPRLWADVSLFLALPALIVGARRRHDFIALFGPAAAYVLLLARNRIQHWAARRVDTLVEQEIQRRELQAPGH